ncbi:MAG: hypothetical protein HYX72_12055 [Acidobacteria bacterium]|nr:hypothetical protein [Acidobacteriota bacterium]
MRTAILLAALAVTLPAIGSSRQEGGAEKGRTLLQQAVAALGGDAFNKVKSQKLAGRVYAFRHDNLSGLAVVTEYIRYPDQQRDEYGKKKEEIEIVNGDKGWRIDWRGAKPISAEELRAQKERRAMGTLHILRYRLNEPGADIQYAGRDFLDNREVELVNFTDQDNRTATIALDRITHLPVRRVWVHRDPKTNQRVEETEILSNYSNVQGIAAPRHLMRKQGDRKVFEAFIQTIQYNIEIPDSMFVPKAQ